MEILHLKQEFVFHASSVYLTIYNSCDYLLPGQDRYKDVIVSPCLCCFNSIPLSPQYYPLTPQISAEVDEVQDIGAADQPFDLLSLDDRQLVDLAACQLGEDFIAICLRRDGL